MSDYLQYLLPIQVWNNSNHCLIQFCNGFSIFFFDHYKVDGTQIAFDKILESGKRNHEEIPAPAFALEEAHKNKWSSKWVKR